jgi:YfiH family protein
MMHLSGTHENSILRHDLLPAPHAFTTRVGGVSVSPFDSLNFGNPSELPPGVVRDPKANIEVNFGRILEAIGCRGRRIVQVHQVHGAAVHVVRRADTASAAPPIVWGDVKADAIVTDDAGCVVAVRVADCCPVLLASADDTVVGAVHAGWRGVVAGVLPEAIGALRTLAGPDSEIMAAIGPCIGPDRFEVGAEVADEFHRVFGGDVDRLLRPGVPGKFFADLKEALALQLRRSGVGRFSVDPGCTASDPVRFFSHRRDAGVTGRMIGIIGPAAR